MRKLTFEDSVRTMWSRTEKTPTCWLWTGCLAGESGHGQMQVNGKPMYVHRLAYLVSKGEIPDGLIVRHTCDVGHCVNPEHLILGTHWDNKHDAMSRGRHARWEKNARAKITREQAQEIRDLRGKEPARVVAPKYNLSKWAVYCIWWGETWS